MALARNFLLSMQFWTWWTEYHTKKHGQENVYIYMAFSSILRKPLILYWNHTISLDRLQHYGITGILHKWFSSRILLWNENNSYREWANIIQEEISNLSSTRVRFGTFGWFTFTTVQSVRMQSEKMHHISGTMTAQPMYRESTRISKFASS